MYIEIEVEKPTKQTFSPFGKLILPHQENPDKSGVGWKCWVPLELLEVGSTKLQIGLVELEKQELKVDQMERHETREEMLWPIDKPIVQLVGLPRHLMDGDSRPKVEEVKAFLLQPGQIVIMNKGTWHAPAYALEDSTSYYYAIELSNIPERDVQPWRKFQNNEIVSMYMDIRK